MATNNYESIIPWRLLQKYLRQQLAQEDYRVRRSTPDVVLVNQGRAQMLEELLELPTALENFAFHLAEDDKS